jgi:hypothetical protein
MCDSYRAFWVLLANGPSSLIGDPRCDAVEFIFIMQNVRESALDLQTLVV